MENTLSHKRVTIIGVGGIGSHVAVALCRAGVGTLRLIDRDAVDVSNLGRQCYTHADVGIDKVIALKAYLEQVNPNVHIEVESRWVSQDTIGDILEKEQFIIEAVDKATTKAWLTEEILQLPNLICLIGCSGMAGWGDSNDIRCKRFRDNWYVCGDFQSDIDELGKITAARVMVCAGHMANKMIQCLSNS
ncbi:sulfur carrier protein ThiS adenylyltransferase ThiF [Veillonella montpellierensis]|uniref:sulfur carrier protein ThiS adenylyltransferase ThiF n=1 Tax=Veillonella montpellierensis TaxID=187328 RepID=UPI00068E7E7D|nr:sulfur carrier protein ThiS adenylyltransferase ThiF [Veillonella montpellierensis]